jgi:hypothetical protein
MNMSFTSAEEAEQHGMNIRKAWEAWKLNRMDVIKKNSDFAQVLDSFARLYESGLDRDHMGIINNDRTKQFTKMLDDSLRHFLMTNDLLPKPTES